ncbi:chymotrypsin inhibitor Ani s 6 [Diabrotica virgifera virgifera]|uniref:Chymotrypsin inhibitor Ani s 6-like n=1 Tax=Diabrotica virgifera virgifera TaxID=50390 RepID=A0A6P7FZR1_DIAVI|nr:chymotrypsin inhibitor Ani s 6 [Diabrotica virgifera virgifera]
MKFTTVAMFCLLFAVTMASPLNKTGSCDDPNAHFGCEYPCKPTCNVRQFAYCGTKCVNDCYCNQDYILSREQGKCVLIQDCFPH